MNPSQTTLDRARALRQTARPRTFQRAEQAESPFPIVLRGYDRAAVESYVAEVNRLIGELRAARTPQAAVREALDRVGEETSAILQRAHQTAEEITTGAHSEAQRRLDAAERDADSLRREAEQHAHELASDSDSVWEQRTVLIEDMRKLAENLLEAADSAAERIPQSPAESVRAVAESARSEAAEPQPAEPVAEQLQHDHDEDDEGYDGPSPVGYVPDHEPIVWRERGDIDRPTEQMDALPPDDESEEGYDEYRNGASGWGTERHHNPFGN